MDESLAQGRVHRVDKMRGISRAAELLSDSQEGLCCMKSIMQIGVGLTYRCVPAGENHRDATSIVALHCVLTDTEFMIPFLYRTVDGCETVKLWKEVVESKPVLLFNTASRLKKTTTMLISHVGLF
jgi:hypothetical protein